MITIPSKCRFCSGPMVPGTTEHQGCMDGFDRVNGWPGGARQLSCLACGRAFESVSKAQRLCHACRSGSGSRVR